MELKFKRRRIQKLIDDFLRRASRLHKKKADSYLIEVETRGTVATSKLLKETMKSGIKDKEKEASNKPKAKSSFYKLHLDIKNFINMKEIFDIKIKFILRKELNIIKKDFYELIINVIKKKRKIAMEVVIVNALNSYLITKDDQEIRQVFFQFCICGFEEMPFEKKKEVTNQDYSRGKNQGGIKSDKEVKYGIEISEVNISNYTFYTRFEGERMTIQFVHLF